MILKKTANPTGISVLCDVDVADMAEWIGAIPFDEWPQQGPGKPSMQSNLAWHGFKEIAEPVAVQIRKQFKEPVISLENWMLSAIMPEHSIEPHVDQQNAARWISRVHMPLLSNAKAFYRIGGVDHVMQVGKAYLIDTRVEHSVRNQGSTPRIHFMLDVMR